MSNPEDIKDDHEKETVVSRNFIENIIDKDLEDGVYSKIVTRFHRSQMVICILDMRNLLF